NQSIHQVPVVWYRRSGSKEMTYSALSSLRTLINMFGPGAFRWLLALTVLAHHTTPLRLGAWAVYVFFILSGYWITRMWDEKYRRTRLPVLTFLVSRWWRLAPVLVCCMAIMISVSWASGWPLPALTPGWVLRQVAVVGSASGSRVLPPQ